MTNAGTLGQALLGLSVVTAVGCVAQAPAPSADALRMILADDWAFWMQASPEAATMVGQPGRHRGWTGYSRAAIEQRSSRLRETLARLDGIDEGQLTDETDRLNFELYRRMTQTAVEGLVFDNEPFPLPGVIPHNLSMPINQMEGIQQDIPRVISLMPAATVADYDDIVARLRGAGTLIDETLELMRDGLARGLTPPRVTLEGVPAQVAGQIVSDPGSSPLLAAFASWPDSIAQTDRERLAAASNAAYAEVVRPAFERLHHFLTDTYLPAARTETSVSALPRGAEMYAYNVRWHVTTAVTPKEIHEIGLREVARLRAEMDQVIADVGFTGGFEAFKRRLRTHPVFFHTTADALVAGYRDIAKRADPELARLFGRLPRTPYGVLRIPDAVAPSQTTAYYEPGALVAGRPGNMYANTYKLDARPTWEMEALTLHEAVPGHHLQIALAQELEGLPEFRRHMSSTAFVEGWALYAESLGGEMGFYRDPYAKFGQLTYDMWRAVRLVVDTGLHSMGWTRQQAIEYFEANAAKTRQDIVVEIDRYIVWPGQALGYKMGQLKIRELRALAQRELGSRFEIRAFHDLVLGQGALPLEVLERRVRAWVQASTPGQ
jgi:uncharacterized protein (DUF885 family)